MQKVRSKDEMNRVITSAEPGSDAFPSFLQERLSNMYIELTSLGLTINQAKIYVYLLGKPFTSVRKVSEDLGLHRVDVYRKLHELEHLGMIEVQIKSPRTYSAAPAKTALHSLLQIQQEKMKNLEAKSGEMISKLEEFKNSNVKPLENSDQDVSYTMVIGRNRYYDEVRLLIRHSHNEVIRILSPLGIIRTFSSGVFNEYVKAKKRGVSVRMISQINSQNRSFAKRLSKVVELRHLDDVHLRFLVADQLVSVISAKFNESLLSRDSSEDNYLVFRDARMAKAHCFFFEHLWKLAKTV